MEFSEWVSQHSVGDALMDSYHHIFFQGVEYLEKAVASGDVESVRERITFLQIYAGMHFDAEEALMTRAGYTDLEGHKLQHQALRERIQELQKQFEGKPEPGTMAEIAETARNWWMQHILQEDMKYAPFIRKK